MSEKEKLTELSAVEIARRVNAGELKAEAVVRAHLGRIKERDKEIRAFLSVRSEEAVKESQALDLRIARGESGGRLAGVPVALKDNMLVRGEISTCGSKILENHRAVYDSTVAARLVSEGAILLGKTNMDEFAMGSSTENSAYAATRNPYDKDRVPGGSSGGSAAAVSAKMVPIALGSDTGGSIRQPAAFCGVWGMKPTYGAVSRYGLVAFASSLDQIGPFTRNAQDAALVLSVIGGHDPLDTTSAENDAPAPSVEGSVKGLRIGLPKEYFESGLAPDVEKAVRAAADAYARLGAEIVDVSLPHTRFALSAYYIIAPSEASSNLARFDGIRYGLCDGGSADSLIDLYEASRGKGFGPEVKRRIMLGTYALSSGYYDAFYIKAQRVRTLIKKDFDDAFKKADILLTPTTPTTAFHFGDKKDPLQMYLSDIYTIPCNISGHCGLSMPCGKDSDGLPIGVQLMGRPFEEGKLLQAAHVLEEAL